MIGDKIMDQVKKISREALLKGKSGLD